MFVNERDTLMTVYSSMYFWKEGNCMTPNGAAPRVVQSCWGSGGCSGHNEKNLLYMSQFPYVVSERCCAWH